MIKIEITCDDPWTLAAHMRALGFTPAAAPQIVVPAIESPDAATARERYEAEQRAKFVSQVINEEGPISEEPVSPLKKIVDEMTAGAAAFSAPTAPPLPGLMDGDRKRGEAGPGHRRRTNAQIKEDEAYFAQKGGIPSLSETVSETPAVPTGEPRVDPADAAQDAADEAAETATRKSDKPTLEDLRAAVGRYTDKVGAKNSIDNLRKILGRPMIEIPEDEILAAIARVEEATGLPVKITVGESATPEAKAFFAQQEPVVATKGDVVEAIQAYGRKYEGTDDPKLLVLTREDMPKILMAVFGEAVKTIPAIPQTPEAYGQALAAINAAVRDNPFHREVKA